MNNPNSTQKDKSRGVDTNLEVKGHDLDKRNQHWFEF